MTDDTTPPARYASDCSYVRLADGWCHYALTGPDSGAPVLLIHGATVPGWEFDRLLPWLHDAGFRTLQLDLFGHGYSDRPRRRHDHALFVRQVVDLLDALEVRQPVHVVAHSLGAAVAAHVAHRVPGRLRRMVLAAPMLDFTAGMPATRLLSLPVVGPLLVHAYVVPMLVRRRTRNYTPIDDGSFAVRFRQQLEKPGFGRSLLSLFRHGALGNQAEAYRRLAATIHDVLLLRGSLDTIVRPETISELRRLLPAATSVEIADTAHAFIITSPEKVGPVVVGFLRDA